MYLATVRGKEWDSITDCTWEDTTAPFKSCRSMDTNLLLANVTKWEDMGCTLGTTPEYLLLLRTHETQKPSISQGLYPILLLALSALTISAYTCLGVSQDSNPQPQLLKVSVYHSATSAICWRVLWQERECERIAAHCQHSNGGAILFCMLEVSSTRVVGEERRAACCQRSNTVAIDCSLRFVEFLDFFPILKNFQYLLFVAKALP